MNVRYEPTQTPAKCAWRRQALAMDCWGTLHMAKQRALGAEKEGGVLSGYADRLSGEIARCSGVSVGAVEGS